MFYRLHSSWKCLTLPVHGALWEKMNCCNSSFEPTWLMGWATQPTLSILCFIFAFEAATALCLHGQHLWQPLNGVQDSVLQSVPLFLRVGRNSLCSKILQSLSADVPGTQKTGGWRNLALPEQGWQWFLIHIIKATQHLNKDLNLRLLHLNFLNPNFQRGKIYNNRGGGGELITGKLRDTPLQETPHQA